MSVGIPYRKALSLYRCDYPHAAPAAVADDLLQNHHPDYQQDSLVRLRIGVNKGWLCHRELACCLQADAHIDEADLASCSITETDVLVIGGGGAGCAAALVASRNGARVILATKLRLGDSNTVMAEGGIQAAIEPDDSPQAHYDDTIKAGHYQSDKQLVADMVMDAPDTLRWLINEGMEFEKSDSGDLFTRRPGGASANRIVYFHDYTGLEMMRALRESVFNSNIRVWDNSPAVELLSSEWQSCAGAVLYSLPKKQLRMVKAKTVILATGGIGQMHLNGFPTTNHFGATGDGLVLAYRLGAKLRDLDSFQYHPTAIAYPSNLIGTLITESVRSAGGLLLNGLGERFVDELAARDVVAAAILRECAQGRGITSPDGGIGVWLDTPTMEQRSSGILFERFPKLYQLVKRTHVDLKTTPLLVYPALHYQNGGIVIDTFGRTSVPGLMSVGEVTGGIHGRNRIMGNALLDIISFGRKAGQKASEFNNGSHYKRSGIEHLTRWRRKLIEKSMSLDIKSPLLFPKMANFKLKL